MQENCYEVLTINTSLKLSRSRYQDDNSLGSGIDPALLSMEEKERDNIGGDSAAAAAFVRGVGALGRGRKTEHRRRLPQR